MSFSSAVDNNLAILLLGTSMTGGLAYGFYRVFKNNPRPATELLRMKNKVILDKDSDEEVWKNNWLKYISNHAINVPSGSTASSSQNSQTKIKDKDIWDLKDWETLKNEKNKAPENFKDKCIDKFSKKFLGTWASDYLDFEKYCTKEKEEEQ